MTSRSNWSKQEWIPNPENPETYIPKFNISFGKRYTAEIITAAVALKRQGCSMLEICDKLGIAASNRTLRKWFKAADVYDPVDGTEY